MRAMVLWIIALLILLGCDAFAPRKAEDPAATADWHPFPTTPEMAYENLGYAWQYRQNVNDYTGLLLGDFLFHFDLEDINEFNTPSAWERDSEIASLNALYYNQGLGEGPTVTFSEDPDRQDSFDASETRLYRYYHVALATQIGDLPLDYAGRCVLDFVEQDGFWKLAEWTDYRTEGNATWGRLKYEIDLQ